MAVPLARAGREVVTRTRAPPLYATWCCHFRDVLCLVSARTRPSPTLLKCHWSRVELRPDTCSAARLPSTLQSSTPVRHCIIPSSNQSSLLLPDLTTVISNTINIDTMLIKRKRSDSELSCSSASTFYSPPRLQSRSHKAPAHLNSRTLKRHRDNRPSEDQVYGM